MEGIIRWFPLDQLPALELEITRRLASRRRTTRRDAIGLALGLHGLRIGEICQATQRDLFPAARTLAVATSKGGKPRQLLLHQSLVAAIQAELSARRIQSPLLLANCRGQPIRQRQLQRLAVEVFRDLLGPLHGLTFHSLRHTFAMRLYAETRDLFLVQRMLGHRSVKTTEIYARSLQQVPESCLVKVGEAIIRPTENHWPGQQLRLWAP
jgi:integrase